MATARPTVVPMARAVARRTEVPDEEREGVLK
jgi:hypothetical protein